MPIFRINDQLHYFAHVPKCGGTSVDAYLTARFGPLGLSEGPRPTPIAEAERWSRSSAAHIPVAALFRFFPREWLVSSFAVVRNPLGRLTSTYFYGRNVTRTIPPDLEFNRWCQEALPRLRDEPYRYDGHLLPQIAFIPKGSRIFRLEEGLDPVIAHLDGLTGTSDGPRQIEVRNVGSWRAQGAAPAATAETLALVISTYAQDFTHFGYAHPTEATEAEVLADLPQGAASVPPRASMLARLQDTLKTRAGMK